MSAHPILSATLAVPDINKAGAEARRLLDLQRKAIAREGAPPYPARLAAPDKLQKQIRKYRREFAAAVSADFGNRSVAESDLAEIMTALGGIQHTKRHLARWMKPQRRSVHWTFQPGK